MPESKMDAETLHKLLQEREQELEIAAKLGQLLLKRNEILETDLSAALAVKESLTTTAAQLKHEVTKKEELLKLYVEDYVYERNVEGEGDFMPEWIHMLKDESRGLRNDNYQLQHEADHLRQQAEDLELKESNIVQQCMKQLTEANAQLQKLQGSVSAKAGENEDLQKKLRDLSSRVEELRACQEHLLTENETLKDNLTEAHMSQAQLAAEVSELQDKHEECTAVIKDAQSEIKTLQGESFLSPPGSDIGSTASSGAEHESLVREIEEAVKREVLAASTLQERPTSPLSYAQNQAKVVMETVKTTMQSQQKREKLIQEIEELLETSTRSEVGAEPVNRPSRSGSMGVSTSLGSVAVSTSLGSVGVSTSVGSVSMSTSMSPIQAASTVEPGVPRTSSPVPSETGSCSVSSVGEELRRHRGAYVPPEKLQIVKPLEGSLTLLKWKLLATPHLGGAASFFSPASRPGIHVKGWKSSGVVDDSSQDTSTLSDTVSTSSRLQGSSTNSSYSVHEAPQPRGSSSPLKNAGRLSRRPSRGMLGGGEGLANLLDMSPMNKEPASKSNSRVYTSPSPRLSRSSRGSKSPRDAGVTGVGLASLLDDDVD